MDIFENTIHNEFLYEGEAYILKVAKSGNMLVIEMLYTNRQGNTTLKDYHILEKSQAIELAEVILKAYN